MVYESDSLRPLPTRRVATRYVVRIGVILHVGERAIEAAMVDISASGALVECAPLGIAPGASIMIEIETFKVDPPIRMLAKHVRDTVTGCALRFADVDPFLRVFVKLVHSSEESEEDPLEKLLAES